MTYQGTRELLGRPFEVIYASEDTSQDDFEAFRADMPWPVLPYGDPRIAHLKQVHKVYGHLYSRPFVEALDRTHYAYPCSLIP